MDYQFLFEALPKYSKTLKIQLFGEKSLCRPIYVSIAINCECLYYLL